MNEEKKVMSEEQKKEARELIEKIFTQLDGAESYLKELFTKSKEFECGALTRNTYFGFKSLRNVRSDFQNSMDLGLY